MAGIDIRPGLVAVVTGAGSGIGKEIVRLLRSCGADVAALDVAEDGLASHRDDSYPGRVLSVLCDVRSADAVDAAAARVLDEFGPVELLCNNAGVVTAKEPLWTQPAADFERVMSVNVIGMANVLRAFLPHMVARRSGHVVNVGSYVGLCTNLTGGNAAYAASKHAVTGLSEIVRTELEATESGIGLTLVCPGPVDTDFIRTAYSTPPGKDDIHLGTPVALPAPSPADIAEAIVRAAEVSATLAVPGEDVAAFIGQRVRGRLESISVV